MTSEYDLRFVTDDPAGRNRRERAYLLEAALWGVGPPLRHIRMKCHECMGGNRGDMPNRGTSSSIEECAACACPLWPYRLGFDPRRTPMDPEEALRRGAIMRGESSRAYREETDGDEEGGTWSGS